MRSMYLLIGGLVLVFIVSLAVFYSRYLVTLYLIAQVSPYEQAGAGAGSILVLGDSTGYGTGARESQTSVAGLLGTDFPEYQIVNNSVNGRRISGLVSVVTTLQGNYDLILLQIGGNDIIAQRPLAEVRRELQLIFTNLARRGVSVVMMSAGNVGAATAFSGDEAAALTDYSRRYHELVGELALAVPQVTYVNLFVEPTADPFVQQPRTYLSLDGLHPSSAGYALWYESLRPVVEEKLQ